MRQLVLLFPDGDLDFEGNGPTADARADNTTLVAISTGNGEQEDELTIGRKYRKLAPGLKQTSFVRFRLDGFPTNFRPMGVLFKMTASRDQVDPPSGDQGFRLAVIESTYRNAHATPSAPNSGGFNSSNYAKHSDMPHISNVDTGSNAGDTLIAGSYQNNQVPTQFAVSGLNAGDRFGVGSVGMIPTPDFFQGGFGYNLELARIWNVSGTPTFAIAIDPVGMGTGLSTPDQFIFIDSAHKVGGQPVEFWCDYEDHKPAFTNPPFKPSIARDETFTTFFNLAISEFGTTDLEWSISSFPPGGGGATIDIGTGEFSWVPAPAHDVGVYVFTIRVSLKNPAIALFGITSQVYFEEQLLTITVVETEGRLAAEFGIETAVAAEGGLGLAVAAQVAASSSVLSESSLELAVADEDELAVAVNAEGALE